MGKEKIKAEVIENAFDLLVERLCEAVQESLKGKLSNLQLLDETPAVKKEKKRKEKPVLEVVEAEEVEADNGNSVIEIDTVRAYILKVIEEEGNARATEVLAEYEAGKLSDLDENQYEAVLKDCIQIVGLISDDDDDDDDDDE